MATNIILVHNHPSGDPASSKEDVSVTNTMMKAGNIVGIKVLDHVIIGKNEYCSMKETGFMDKMEQ